MKGEISELPPGLPHASDTDLWPSFPTVCRRIRYIYTDGFSHAAKSKLYIV